MFKAISKKEASRLTKEMLRLQKLLGGIRDMKVLPDVVFVIDPVDTAGAVRESYALGIPVVAVCDTNANPDMISIPVPGNDDAARSIKLFCSAIADSILEGKAELEAVKTAENKPAENPVMAQAFESAMLAAENAEPAAVEKVAVEEVVKADEAADKKAEEVVAEVKAEEAKEEEKAAKKPAAKKKTTAKKTTAKAKKTVKAAKAETEEAPAKEEAK